MGYTTDFSGQITVEPPFNEQEMEFLRKFSRTRRMNRTKGPYFVDGTGDFGQGADFDILDHNRPPSGQPGLWCHWTPSDGGHFIEWDGGEKFDEADEWMKYLIEHFIKPGHRAPMPFLKDHVCNGEIFAQGEEPDDRWMLIVKDNVVSVAPAKVTIEYQKAVKI